MMLRKYLFLALISNYLFFNCGIATAESMSQGNGPPVIKKEPDAKQYDIMRLNEKLDELYKKKEEISEVMLKIDKEIFELQKMIIEKNAIGN